MTSSNASVVECGGEIIGATVCTLADINTSSSRISDIIGTTDGIALQTNILASNAVARGIKELIGTSIEQVESGMRVVPDAGGTIGQIVEVSRRMRERLGDVATAARKVTAGVAQTARSVQELDSVTQQEPTLVEQTAAATCRLRDQGQSSAAQLLRFRLPV